MNKREISKIQKQGRLQLSTILELMYLLRTVLGYESYVTLEIQAGSMIKTIITEKSALETISKLKKKVKVPDTGTDLTNNGGW